MARLSGRCARPGYTILEVLITVALIVIVIALTVPHLQNSKRTARMAMCASNLHQIHAVLRLHRADATLAGGKVLSDYPEPDDWLTFVEDRNAEPVLVCPEDGTPESYLNHIKLNTGIDFMTPPPPSVDNNDLKSDDTIFMFREREAFTLPSDVSAILTPGSYGKNGDHPTFAEDGVIPAGTVVDVYYFHYDSVTNQGGGSTTIGFSNPVLGFIGTNPGLNATDPLLGVSGTTYPTGSAGRRLEQASDPNGDSVTLTDDRHEVIYGWAKANPAWLDTMRVITESGGASSYGMNNQVRGHDYRGSQVLLADYEKSIIDLDGIDEDDDLSELLAPRHLGKANVMRVDGSIEHMTVDELTADQMIWHP